MAAGGLLTHGQLEGLGAPTSQAVMPPWAVGPSWLSMAAAVQPCVVVATQPPHPPLPPVVQQPPTMSPTAQQPPMAASKAQKPLVPALISPSMPVTTPVATFVATQPALDILAASQPPPPKLQLQLPSRPKLPMLQISHLWLPLQLPYLSTHPGTQLARPGLPTMAAQTTVAWSWLGQQ